MERARPDRVIPARNGWAAALLALALPLSGCALLMPAYTESTVSFTSADGHEVTCSSGRRPVNEDGDEALSIEDCADIADASAEMFMTGLPDAEVTSVRIEAGEVVEVCYTLHGTPACEAPQD